MTVKENFTDTATPFTAPFLAVVVAEVDAADDVEVVLAVAFAEAKKVLKVVWLVLTPKTIPCEQ